MKWSWGGGGGGRGKIWNFELEGILLYYSLRIDSCLDSITDEPLTRQVETPGLDASGTPEPIREEEKGKDETVKGKTSSFQW